jgi:uncharacterized protein YoxC
MNAFLAQTVNVEPEAIQAISELGIVSIALIVLGIVLFQVFRVLNKSLDSVKENTAALEKITDRIAVNQSHDETLREKSREVFDKASRNFEKVGDVLERFRLGVDEKLDETTNALRGDDGVLERLKTSITQIGDLNTKTQSVVDSANSIIENLDIIKEAVGKMNSSDDEVKTRIEEIQTQLKELTGAVSSIPAAVGDAERNIIAVIERRTDTRPVPDVISIGLVKESNHDKQDAAD